MTLEELAEAEKLRVRLEGLQKTKGQIESHGVECRMIATSMVLSLDQNFHETVQRMVLSRYDIAIHKCRQRLVKLGVNPND